MIQGLAALLVLLCELEVPELPSGHGVDDPRSHQLYFLPGGAGQVGEALHFRRQGHRDFWMVSGFSGKPACTFEAPMPQLKLPRSLQSCPVGLRKADFLLASRLETGK